MAIKVLQNTEFAVSHSDAVKMRGESKTLTQKIVDIDGYIIGADTKALTCLGGNHITVKNPEARKYVITNGTPTSYNYGRIAIPPLSVGEKYKMVFKYTSTNTNPSSTLCITNNSNTRISGIVNLAQTTDFVEVTYEFTYNSNMAYICVYSTDTSANAIITISDLYIYNKKTLIGILENVNGLENNIDNLQHYIESVEDAIPEVRVGDIDNILFGINTDFLDCASIQSSGQPSTRMNITNLNAREYKIKVTSPASYNYTYISLPSLILGNKYTLRFKYTYNGNADTTKINVSFGYNSTTENHINIAQLSNAVTPTEVICDFVYDELKTRIWTYCYNFEANTELIITDLAIYDKDVLPKMVEDVSLELKNVTNRLNFKELYIGTLIKQTDKVVITSDTYSLPRDGITIIYKGVVGLSCRVYYGSDKGATNYKDIRNGGSYTIPSGERFYRIGFSNYANITPSSVQALLDNGTIRVETNMIDESIVMRQRASEKYARAAMAKQGQSNMHPIPTFIHTSDIHGDANGFRDVMEYADYLGVDGVINTGDSVLEYITQGAKYLEELGNNHTTPLLVCIGNHDTGGGTNINNTDVFNSFINPLVSKNEYRQDNDNPASNPWYYKDFENKNIRVVSLDLYDDKFSPDTGCKLSSSQVEWFRDTLLSTPDNYGVLVILHTIPKSLIVPSNKDSFYSKATFNRTYLVNITGDNPITKMIDLFISGASGTITYANSGSSSISVDVDFSSKNNGVEFIAYLNGHQHLDSVGYIDGTTNPQLNLNVTCCINVYGNDRSGGDDVPRGDGVTRDAFNVYGIDRKRHEVRIARVGSDVTWEGRNRKYMVIPYNSIPTTESVDD